MSTEVRKEVVWLAALALWPVVALGQEILIDPQNQTVCVWEEAKFTSEVKGGLPNWLINNISLINLPTNKTQHIRETSINTDNATFVLDLRFTKYDEFFDGAKVESIAVLPPSHPVISTASYLFYETNQQFQVTGLIGAVNNGTAQIYWNAHNSNYTTQYLFGVYDNDGNLIANQTTDATQISYDLPDSPCHRLTFKVTANQCPDPESPFIQTEGATFVYREPDIDLSPAIAAIVRFLSNQAVRASWALDSDNAFQIVLTDLESGEQSIYNSTSPLSYRPPLCGKPVKLKVSITPAECPDDPNFTRSDTINFTVPCPTRATEVTEPEPEVSGEHSGTQALYPSLPVIAAAVAVLLKYQLQN